MVSRSGPIESEGRANDRYEVVTTNQRTAGNIPIPSMEFSGRLAAFPIGDILQWAHNDRRTGALVVRRSGCEKRVFFRDGEIVACFSDDAAEFFGQHLLVRGLVDEGRLIHALTVCQRGGGMLGGALVELGILTAEGVASALREHVEDQVCELFLWRNGIFYFSNEMLGEDQLLPLSLSATAVALEGSRRSDEYQRLRRVFVHDQVVLKKGTKKRENPGPLEKRILRVVDGRRTLAELYHEVRGSWFRFLDCAYRMTVDSVLDIGDVRDASDSHSTELRLADLLIEQVSEEQSIFLRQHLAIPFDALSHCVPVWVRPPDSDEESRMSQPVRAFYRQIDGKSDLSQLLADVSRDERSRRMDRLILQLRKGALALLPMAIDDLEGVAEREKRPANVRWWRRLRGEG